MLSHRSPTGPPPDSLGKSHHFPGIFFADLRFTQVDSLECRPITRANICRLSLLYVSFPLPAAASFFRSAPRHCLLRPQSKTPEAKCLFFNWEDRPLNEPYHAVRVDCAATSLFRITGQPSQPSHVDPVFDFLDGPIHGARVTLRHLEVIPGVLVGRLRSHKGCAFELADFKGGFLGSDGCHRATRLPTRTTNEKQPYIRARSQTRAGRPQPGRELHVLCLVEWLPSW